MAKNFLISQFIILFLPVLFFSQTTAKINYFSPQHFQLVQNHIINTGKCQKTDVSAGGTGSVIIEYCTINHQSFELTTDKTVRIFFKSKDGIHYGNVLMDQGKVKLEIIEKEKKTSYEKIITKEYSAIINELLETNGK